jgi:RNA polymerase sigma factor (sigma-70 family)
MEDVARDRARARAPAEPDAETEPEAARRAPPVPDRRDPLVERVTRSTLPPFESFLEANKTMVFQYLLAAVGRDSADDVFQETFLAALRAYPRCTEADRLDRWVLRIASRKAIDNHRRAARRPIPVAALPELPGHPAPDAGAAVAALAELPQRQRDAITYRHVLGFTVAETAELMRCSPETVRANAYQGMKRLKGRTTWAMD